MIIDLRHDYNLWCASEATRVEVVNACRTLRVDNTVTLLNSQIRLRLIARPTIYEILVDCRVMIYHMLCIWSNDTLKTIVFLTLSRLLNTSRVLFAIIFLLNDYRSLFLLPLTIVQRIGGELVTSGCITASKLQGRIAIHLYRLMRMLLSQLLTPATSRIIVIHRHRLLL